MGCNHLKTSFVFIFISLTLSAILVSGCLTFPPWIEKYHVHVANHLPNNSHPLTVRCQSKDDDIGTHTLYVNEEIQWHFCTVNFNTLFFCHFWWANKDASLDVFNGDLSDSCHNNFVNEGKYTCYWTVREHNICLVTDDDFGRCHDW
ncbi:hypothetical protein M9H77_33771 [Catharanthus roseus]|uniref:Uncharacterized protein n=1 Tax=Catharanthus roseus TaxID=4058 RepID=A0ACB9ZJA9_CATRO|nr:hypothetical protein M9H77_33771 [Catharanthus roseus]